MLTEPTGRMYGLDVRSHHIKNYLAYSMKRLNVDYIDLYQPARIDLGIPIEETIGAISYLVKEGYVRHIGVTQVNEEVLRKANAVHPISLIEPEYSLFNRSMEKDILPTARELGVGVAPFGVLAHGLLSGSFTKEKVGAHNSWIPLFAKDNIDKNFLLVEELKKIAAEKEVNLPQLVIAWVLSKGEDILPIVGANRPSTFHDSLKSIEINLEENDLKKIEAAVPESEIAGSSFPNAKFRNGKHDN